MFIARGAITEDHHGFAATSAGFTLLLRVKTSSDGQVGLGRTAARRPTPPTAISRPGMREEEERKVERVHLLATSKLTAQKEDLPCYTPKEPLAVARKQHADNKNGTNDLRG